MVVTEPLEINNGTACSLKVLSHLRSNKRKRTVKKEGGWKERENEAYCHRDYTSLLVSILLLPFALSLYYRTPLSSLPYDTSSSSLASEMMTARASSR